MSATDLAAFCRLAGPNLCRAVRDRRIYLFAAGPGGALARASCSRPGLAAFFRAIAEAVFRAPFDVPDLVQSGALSVRGLLPGPRKPWALDSSAQRAAPGPPDWP